MTRYDPDIAKSHEPITITADQIAGFLERCNRPRAAAWVDDLGGNYERAMKTIEQLREEKRELIRRLRQYEPAKELFGEPPRNYRSQCE